MAKAARDKGRRGQREAQELLKSRDWSVAELNAGTSAEDFIAVSPDGRSYSVEVKNTVAITTAHRAQAMTQAKARKLPWMLLSKIAAHQSCNIWVTRNVSEFVIESIICILVPTIKDGIRRRRKWTEESN